MKTINPKIQIFGSLKSAEKFFDTKKTAVLLYAPGVKNWFVSDDDSPLKEWPNLYQLINKK